MSSTRSPGTSTWADLVGIGVGPANLGLAALLDPVPSVETRFFERRPAFAWHDGAMLPEAQLQVSPLKDLVTLADPTSRFSFLNFLSVHGRLYRHLIASRSGTARQEFEQYYRWAAGLLPQLTFDSEITDIGLDNGVFAVRGRSGDPVRTRNLVLGTGREPYVPGFAGRRSDRVVHAAEIMRKRPTTRGRRVVVIGGGQSGAEIVHWLLGDAREQPASLVWSTRRDGFLPLDDSAFANEWFFPRYVRHFTELPVGRRTQLMEEQRLASDGVSADLLDAIYAQLYRLDTLEPGRCAYRLCPGQEVVGVEGGTGSGPLRVVSRDADTDTLREEPADLVVLATGYHYRLPEFLEPLRTLIPVDEDGFRVREDYSIDFDGPAECRIYVQNAARHTHGVADSNLSLMAWRNVVIANAVAGRELYPADRDTSTIAWSRASDVTGRPDSALDLLPTHAPRSARSGRDDS
ncbi:SidA/IucD/PvdA family monooxygenase [Streptomyces sp. NPDC048411]|uniref:lysine N(6)-hydroxylase/L-ornithine N(5)-oxygenase family protein n=1 Tax=Streptomyces sp. NPDC048411 TaxID=3157206 RepID=UPI003453C646